jgi:hypothetical protein
MTTKCYIVDYDRKISNYRDMLHKINNYDKSLYNEIYNEDDSNEKYKTQLNEKNTLHQYLNNINEYLDEMLESPGMTDEDIYNLKKDQREVIDSINDIGKSIQSLGSKCEKNKVNTNGNVASEQKLEDKKRHEDSPNITININNGEKKNTFYPGRKIDPQKIKF